MKSLKKIIHLEFIYGKKYNKNISAIVNPIIVSPYKCLSPWGTVYTQKNIDDNKAKFSSYCVLYSCKIY